MSMNCLAYELYWTTLSRNMNPVVAKQVALDNSLVPSEKRLKIEKCNAIIEFSKPQREETYQVTLDALKLSPCYPAFLITAEVPEVYMHQFWNTIQKIKDTDAYRFKLDKKKFRVDTEVFLEILQICPRLHNQAFVEPPSEEELVTFIQELGASLGSQQDLIDLGNHELKSCRQYGAPIPDDMINQDIKDSKAYKTYYDFATRKATPKKARKFKKVASPSRKLAPILEEEPAVKPKRAKKLPRSLLLYQQQVLQSETLVGSLCRRRKHQLKLIEAKAWIYFMMWHYLKLLSSTKLLRKASWKLISFMKVAQVMELVPNQSENESCGDSDDDDDNDDDSDEVTKDDDEDDVESDADADKEASDSEKTDYDEDENLNLNQNDDEEEENEEEYVHTEHVEQGKKDEEMMDASRDDSTPQTKYEQVKDNEHVTLTTVHDTQKTKGPMQSSFVSSDFANQFLNLDNAPPTDSEVVSMMNVNVRHEEPSTRTPPLLNIPVTVIPETSTAARSTIPLTIPPITPL
ncbi:hypothetical protein Tco_0922004 [Tanacetum coccineum]|uniref:Uncharacterized protein n=1 Tax=Tanacetum coccineum TaxID=301880 RepID=A0ABQ5CY19_9ASTR